jgi:hypothetical protein
VDLVAHAADSTASRVPIHLTLPIRQPDGARTSITWTAYHHNQREFGVSDCAIDPVSFADVECVDLGLEDVDLHHDAAATAAAVRPSNHVLEDGVKYLRPVMVADGTVYAAEAGVRLVPHYFARVDAMANRQDLFFALVQLSAQEAPASLTSLEAWSNAFSIRTRIAGYRRFTPTGQAGFTFPATECDAADSLIQA